MKYIIGIDPGLSGGLSFYNPNHLQVWATPTYEVDYIKKVKGKAKKLKRKNMDLNEVWDLISCIQQENVIECAYIEHVTAGRNQGVTGMFRFGQNFGQWEGLLVGMGIRVELVRPQIWKKSCDLIKADKNASRELATSLFPDNSDSFRLVKYDGLAEASLIARYGWGIENDAENTEV